MARDPIGATMTIDISQLEDSLKEANRLIKLNESNWLENAATMDDWTKSETGLTKRMQFLSKTIEQQEKNIEGIIKAKEEAIEKYGAESYEVEKINNKLSTHSKALEKSRKEYKQVSSSLDKMTAETNDAGEELEDVTKETKKATKELDRLEDSAKDAGDGFSIAGGAIATFAGNVLTSLVASVGSAVSSLFNLTESTLEYRREMARVTTVADQVGVAGDRIIDKWIDMNAVIQDESSVTEGLNNLMTAGFTAEKELDGITKALEGASIQWAETLKFEGLSDSLQEWIGSDGASLTGQFAELLERLGYNLDDVTEATKGMTDAQRRNWAIQTLNKAGLDEVSESYRNANADMIAYNKANSDLLHAQSMLGEAMQPFVTTVKQSAADILYSFVDMANGVEGAGDQLLYNVGYLAGKIYSGVRDLLAQILPSISGFFPEVVELVATNLPLMLEQGVAIISSIINGMAENIPLVTGKISEMLSNIILTISENAPTLFNSALNLFGQIVLAIPQMLIDLSANLPQIITSITDGLVNGEQSIFDTAINVLSEIVRAIPSVVADLLANMPDIITAILNALSEALPKVFDGAILLLGEIVNAIPSIVSSLAQNLPKIINAILNGLSSALPKVATGAANLFMEIVKAIPVIAGTLLENMPQIIKSIITGLLNGAGELFSAGVDLIKGLVEGILSFDVVGALKSVGTGIINGFKSFFGIHSPSKLMEEEIGKPIGEGVAEGIENTEGEIVESAETLGDGFIKGFSDGVKKTEKEMTKAVESTVNNALEDTTINPKTGTGLAQEIGQEVKKAMTDYSKYVKMGNDMFSTLKGGNEQDIADSIFDIAGQVGGPWGMLADAIWSFISDNLLNQSNEEIQETATQMVNSLLDTIMMVLTNLPQIVSGAIQFMKTFALGLIEGIPEIVEQLPKIIQALVTVLIAEGIPAMIRVGVELIKMLIKSMFNWQIIWEGIKAVFNGIIDGFKSLFGIKSPSKVMADEIGKNISLGIAEGVEDNLGSVNDAIRNGVDTSLQVDGVQRKQVNVYQTNNYSQAHSRYELYKSRQDTASAVKLALQGV